MFKWGSSRQNHVTESGLLFSCIVLDAPMIPHGVFVRMWNNSILRICAGAGANVLYDNSSKSREFSAKRPHVIVGDLTRLRDDVRNHFEGIGGVHFVNEVDADTNDLDKSLEFLEAFLLRNPNISASLESGRLVVGITGCTDRQYQALTVVDSIVKCTNKALRLVHVAGNDITIVLRAGIHEMQIPKSSIGQPCVVIPLSGPVSYIISTGLARNLPKHEGGLALGSSVTTDNRIKSDTVTFETNGTILFTFQH